MRKIGLKGVFVFTLCLAGGSALAFDLPKFSIFGGGDDKGGQPESDAQGTSCPEFLIANMSPELRVPAGADAGSVRYQIKVSQMARQCAVQGDTLSIKIGVEGAAVLGPAGQPGSYYGTLKVAVQRAKDDTVLGSNTYRVGGTIAAGETRAPFRLVADPISVPNDAHAGDEYVVVVAMQGGGDAEAAASKPKGKRRKK
jgi:hypothetical protein